MDIGHNLLTNNYKESVKHLQLIENLILNIIDN